MNSYTPAMNPFQAWSVTSTLSPIFSTTSLAIEVSIPFVVVLCRCALLCTVSQSQRTMLVSRCDEGSLAPDSHGVPAQSIGRRVDGLVGRGQCDAHVSLIGPAVEGAGGNENT